MADTTPYQKQDSLTFKHGIPASYMHKSSPYLYMRVQNACWGSFVAGYTISELGVSFNYLATNFGTAEENKRNLCTTVVTVLSASALISAYLSQYMMLKMERRKFMMLADWIFIFATGLSQVSVWWVFMLARMVMGIAVGMNASVISLYIREISPDNMAGKTGALVQANTNLGIICGFLLNLPLQENVTEATTGNHWRFVFITPAIVCFIRFIMLVFYYNVDTPYYYYRIGQNEKGRNAIKQIYQEKHVLNIERQFLSPGSIDFSDLEAKDIVPNRVQEDSFYNRVKIGMAINFLQQMCGNTFLAVYSTSVLGIIAQDHDTMCCFVLGSYLFLFFVSTLGVSFNRKLARKRYLVGGFFVCGLMQLALAIISSPGKNQLAVHISLRFLFIISLFAFYAAYNFSVGPVTSIFTSDILKDKGMSYSIVMNWLGNTISLLLNYNTELSVNFYVFSACAFCGFICSLKFVVETRYKDFNDILKTYQNPYEGEDFKDSSIKNIQLYDTNHSNTSQLTVA